MLLGLLITSGVLRVCLYSHYPLAPRERTKSGKHRMSVPGYLLIVPVVLVCWSRLVCWCASAGVSTCAVVNPCYCSTPRLSEGGGAGDTYATGISTKRRVRRLHMGICTAGHFRLMINRAGAISSVPPIGIRAVPGPLPARAWVRGVVAVCVKRSQGSLVAGPGLHARMPSCCLTVSMRIRTCAYAAYVACSFFNYMARCACRHGCSGCIDICHGSV